MTTLPKGRRVSSTPPNLLFRFFEALCRRVVQNVYLRARFLYTLHSNVWPSDDFAAVWPDSLMFWGGLLGGKSSGVYFGVQEAF